MAISRVTVNKGYSPVSRTISAGVRTGSTTAAASPASRTAPAVTKPAVAPAPAVKVTLSASPRSDVKPPLADKPVAYTPTTVSANKASASRGFDGPVGKSAPATSPIIKSDSQKVPPSATMGERAAQASKPASPSSPASRETDRSRVAASDTILDKGSSAGYSSQPARPAASRETDRSKAATSDTILDKGSSAGYGSQPARPTVSRETDRSRAAASDTILDRGQEQASTRAPLPPAQMQVHDDDTFPYRISNKVAHVGIDLEAPKGTPISAVKGGVVETAFNGCPTDGVDAPDQCGNNLGNHVKIKHDDGSKTVYAHMQPGTITVADGQPVAAGQVIGQVGSTGRSSGPHLHWEYYNAKDQRDNPLTLIPGQYEDLTSTRKAGEM